MSRIITKLVLLLAVFCFPHFPLPLPPSSYAAEPPKNEHEVPYRLTDTKHILVRVRINGKGPYNFIVDTGSDPFKILLYLAKQDIFAVLKARGILRD